MAFSGLDHVVIAVADLDAGVACYETLLGRACIARENHDGAATAIIATDNVAVELIAPGGAGAGALRVRNVLQEGEGLKSLALASGALERMHRRCQRLALSPGTIKQQPGWRSFRLDGERCHGVRIFCVERVAPLRAAPMAPGGVSGLDHLVVRSASMERAAAFYGARLGLDMRLDSEVAGRRLMFFRAGDAIVEVAHDAPRARDELWGLSWRVADADGARARLLEAGLDVSEVREGFKPGTRVFTVRSGACGTPTLMLEPPAPRGAGETPREQGSK